MRTAFVVCLGYIEFIIIILQKQSSHVVLYVRRTGAFSLLFLMHALSSMKWLIIVRK